MSRPLPVPGALVAAAAVALTLALPPARAAALPGYTAVDTRLAGCRPRDVELAVVGKNLFDPSHAEWGPADNRVEFQRAFRVQLRWRL